MGYVIKLIARTKKLESGKISIMVSPALVSKESMLAGVNGVFNACLVRGDMTGDVLMYGKGAGKLATASAVVGDVIDCASNHEERKFFGWEDEKADYIECCKNVETALFVRVKTACSNCVEKATAAAKEIFGAKEICLGDGEVAFITAVDTEKALFEKLENSGLNTISVIRVTDY